MAAENMAQELDRVPIAEREAYQVRELRRVVEHAYRHAPAIKRKFDQAGVRPADIASVRDLERLSVTKKDDLMQLQYDDPPFGGFLAAPFEELKRIYVSPGFIYDPQGLNETKRMDRAFAAAGVGKGDRVLNTWSYHMVPAGLMIDEAIRKTGATVIPTGVGSTDQQVRIVKDLKVTVVCASTAFFTTLMQKAREMGLDPLRDFSLKAAFIGGEVGGGWRERRLKLEEEYRIRTFCAYATGDLGLVGYECEEKDGYHLHEDMIVEIVDPATGKQLPLGETGEVVVTPFNEVYPLIRFGTGDASYLMTEPCPCGRTAPRLGLILGRVGDAIKVREIFVYPRQIDEIVAKFPQLAKGQAIICRPGFREEMHFRAELAGEESDRAALEKEIAEFIPRICTVRADRVEFLAPGTLEEGYKKVVDKK